MIVHEFDTNTVLSPDQTKEVVSLVAFLDGAEKHMANLKEQGIDISSSLRGGIDFDFLYILADLNKKRQSALKEKLRLESEMESVQDQLSKHEKDIARYYAAWEMIDDGTKHFDLILDCPGEKRTAVIKTVKQITGKTLMDAKKLVDDAPVTIAGGWSEPDVHRMKQELESIGATVRTSRQCDWLHVESAMYHVL